ncbi:hypothetical protein BD410DRAFT_807039 [Rickenella mellea]|uniref:Uncharacterized protein n=1 Tax=Rickenella mellea TaxID=50990 RepID=A0A4Y7PRX3_9AGAM|nr:hypothetical protein BD410DRAFT_807039 [Rickenella mellea]
MAHQARSVRYSIVRMESILKAQEKCRVGWHGEIWIHIKRTGQVNCVNVFWPLADSVSRRSQQIAIVVEDGEVKTKYDTGAIESGSDARSTSDSPASMNGVPGLPSLAYPLENPGCQFQSGMERRVSGIHGLRRTYLGSIDSTVFALERKVKSIAPDLATPHTMQTVSSQMLGKPRNNIWQGWVLVVVVDDGPDKSCAAITSFPTL